MTGRVVGFLRDLTAVEWAAVGMLTYALVGPSGFVRTACIVGFVCIVSGILGMLTGDEIADRHRARQLVGGVPFVVLYTRAVGFLVRCMSRWRVEDGTTLSGLCAHVPALSAGRAPDLDALALVGVGRPRPALVGSLDCLAPPRFAEREDEANVHTHAHVGGSTT